MQKLIWICTLCFCFSGFAQNNTEEIQQEIDAKVWKPFQNAFETLDGKALNAIYADKVIRVTPGGIDTKNEFKTKNLERFNRSKADGISIKLDFWFDSRHTNTNTSYEVGFYRIVFTDKDGKTNSSYGQFHIVLKKMDGQWKITQDWDTAKINGQPITEMDFAKHNAIKF